MSTEQDIERPPDPTIRGALARLGLTSASASCLAVTSTKDTNLPPDVVWETWSHLEQWSRWSKPLLISARWLEGRTWEVGAQFEQTRAMGAPIGRQVTVETVREVNPGQSVAWWDGKGGSIRTCKVWYFELLPDGGTRVHCTGVFVGPLVFLFKFALRKNLQRGFDSAVEGLIKSAEREHPGHA